MPVRLAALGMLVLSLESAVNVALPAMAQAFAIGPAEIRWVIICYVLTYAITSVVAGVVADRVGPVPVYTVGLVNGMAAVSARSRPGRELAGLPDRSSAAPSWPGAGPGSFCSGCRSRRRQASWPQG